MPEQLRFGVELEMVLRPKQATLTILENYYGFVLIQNASHSFNPCADTNRNGIMQFLRDYLRQSGYQ